MNWNRVVDQLFVRAQFHYDKGKEYIQAGSALNDLVTANVIAGDVLFGIATAITEGLRDESDKNPRTDPSKSPRFGDGKIVDLQRP